MSSSVEYLSDRLKRFLTCGVPYLKLEYLLIKFDEQSAEFHSHSDFVICQELIVCQSVEQARLAHCCVANDDQLEKEVLVRYCFVLKNLVWHHRQFLHKMIRVLIHLILLFIILYFIEVGFWGFGEIGRAHV